MSDVRVQVDLYIQGRGQARKVEEIVELDYYDYQRIASTTNSSKEFAESYFGPKYNGLGYTISSAHVRNLGDIKKADAHREAGDNSVDRFIGGLFKKKPEDSEGVEESEEEEEEFFDEPSEFEEEPSEDELFEYPQEPQPEYKESKVEKKLNNALDKTAAVTSNIISSPILSTIGYTVWWCIKTPFKLVWWVTKLVFGTFLS